MVLPKPKKRLRSESNRNSHASSLSISVGTLWAKMAILSESLASGSIFGKLLMDFSSFVRRSLASESDTADAFEGSAMPLFLDDVDSMEYAMTRSGVGIVGGTRSFCCFMKKNSRLGLLVSVLSFCHISLSDILLARFADSRVMLLLEVFQTTHPDFYIFFAHWALYFAISDDKGCSFLVFLRGR